tara:strand:+ start:1096 stop:1335 length:240 start_codon:yes stop_codon:yes gene_type:complete
MIRINIKNITLIFTCMLFFSCNGWTEKDKSKYLIECQRAKLDSAFCECSLQKITTNYSSFEDAMYNEEDFLEIFKECKK